jgi:hypothetical protein
MLLRISVAVFAAAISLGLWSGASNTVLAHDIYSPLRNRDGSLCCGGQDCKPVEAIVLSNGSYYLPDVMKLFPPTWQHHHLMIASTIVSIIQWQTTLIAGVDQYGKTNLRLGSELINFSALTIRS